MNRQRSVIVSSPLCDNCEVTAVLPVGRGDEADATTKVLVIVPTDKALDSVGSTLHGVEARAVFSGTVLVRAEDGRDVAVVSADLGLGRGRYDADRLRHCEHGDALHGPTVVGVTDTFSSRPSEACAAGMQEVQGEGAALLLVDDPAHVLAAPDIQIEVAVQEAPAHCRGQTGDIPADWLARARGNPLNGSLGDAPSSRYVFPWHWESIVAFRNRRR